jgi:hypothetical protein
MALAQSNYAVQKFGKYSFNVCQETNYFDCLDLLQVYNENNDKKKLMKDMNKFMQRSPFMKAIVADFNKVANMNKLDMQYLNQLDENFTGSNFDLVNIEQEYDPQEFLDLDKDIKYKYMVREISTKKGTMKKIKELKIHPMTAVGIAMWMSSDFCAEVKDTFLRFIEGDLTLVKDIVVQINEKTDMINNINVVTNPEDGVPLMLVKTYEKDSKEARYEYMHLLDEIKRLNGVITIKDDNIDALRKEVQELLALSRSTNGMLKETKETLTETKETLDKTHEKVSKIMPERVDLSRIPLGKQTWIVIMRNMKPSEDLWGYYAMRVQYKSIDQRVKKMKKDYGDDYKSSYKIEHPNAVLLWEDVKQKFAKYLELKPGSNWFDLRGITTKEFFNKLNKLDKNRKSLM